VGAIKSAVFKITQCIPDYASVTVFFSSKNKKYQYPVLAE